MVRGAYYDKNGVKKGAWSKEEDERLRAYVERYGHSNWRQLPKLAGRTDNEVKNHWHSHLKKRVELCNCNDELQMKPTCEIQTTHENPIPPANAPSSNISENSHFNNPTQISYSYSQCDANSAWDFWTQPFIPENSFNHHQHNYPTLNYAPNEFDMDEYVSYFL
ncbi:transcription factor MYB14-like [Senna tora]|uniref:Transcription factor MYB14-like n=1 Tax=Senna tora TaxID=362788 RepID=A0A834SK94_9FABA|nr:transcription factor MYB14-like [Senna tora]